MTHYSVGDRPAETIVIEPVSVPDAATYTTVTATIQLDEHTTVLEAGWIEDDGDDLVAVLLDGWEASQPGLWRLLVVLEHDTARRALPTIWVPVEEDTGWYLIDDAVRDWPGAPEHDDRVWRLLDSARIQCLEFAPTLPEGAPVPSNYRDAQLEQARNGWNSMKTDPSSSTLGAGDFQVPVYPLDWSVKQKLRPKRAVPKVG